jgi:hypothetical protein
MKHAIIFVIVLSVKEKYKELYYNELYTQGVSGENVADKLKVTQPEKEKTVAKNG